MKWRGVVRDAREVVHSTAVVLGYAVLAFALLSVLIALAAGGAE